MTPRDARGSEWQELPFTEAFVVNPSCKLTKGKMYPFIEMSAISTGSIDNHSERSYTGGGSRFECGDTLFARITPCLENGKIARVKHLPQGKAGHGSTEFIVMRGRDGVSDSLFAYYTAVSPDVREYAIQHMTGTSGRQRVPTDVFNYLYVSLPPLPAFGARFFKF